MIKTALNQYVSNAMSSVDQLHCENLMSYQMEASPLVIDVREKEEFNKGKIEGAISIPRGVLEMQICQIESITSFDTPIVLYCQTGGRSSLAARALNQLGFTNVKSLTGGYKQWSASL